MFLRVQGQRAVKLRTESRVESYYIFKHNHLMTHSLGELGPCECLYEFVINCGTILEIPQFKFVKVTPHHKFSSLYVPEIHVVISNLQYIVEFIMLDMQGRI